jgi:hypothetical protein
MGTIYHSANGLTKSNRPPDEVIAERRKAPSAIPVRERCAHFQPPESDLLNAIHYYISRTTTNQKYIFDESALLALGYLVDHWIQETMNDRSHNVYAVIKDGDRRTPASSSKQ